jgi:hypothetical protein
VIVDITIWFADSVIAILDINKWSCGCRELSNCWYQQFELLISTKINNSNCWYQHCAPCRLNGNFSRHRAGKFIAYVSRLLQPFEHIMLVIKKQVATRFNNARGTIDCSFIINVRVMRLLNLRSDWTRNETLAEIKPIAWKKRKATQVCIILGYTWHYRVSSTIITSVNNYTLITRDDTCMQHAWSTPRWLDSSHGLARVWNPRHCSRTKKHRL